MFTVCCTCGPHSVVVVQVVEDVREAGFILAHGTECLGRGDGQEPVPITAEEVRSLLREAANQQIPLLIANPDIVTVDQSDLRIMPGTFGRWYKEMGGQVIAGSAPPNALPSLQTATQPTA